MFNQPQAIIKFNNQFCSYVSKAGCEYTTDFNKAQKLNKDKAEAFVKYMKLICKVTYEVVDV